MLIFPEHLRYKAINAIILPVIIIFPVCTMLMGLILIRQRDRRKVERDLTVSQKLLSREQSLMRGLIDSLPDLISFKDTQGRYLGCNHAFERYVGLTEKELKAYENDGYVFIRNMFDEEETALLLECVNTDQKIGANKMRMNDADGNHSR